MQGFWFPAPYGQQPGSSPVPHVTIGIPEPPKACQRLSYENPVIPPKKTITRLSLQPQSLGFNRLVTLKPWRPISEHCARSPSLMHSRSSKLSTLLLPLATIWRLDAMCPGQSAAALSLTDRLSRSEE